jgi:hypothetical protein
MAAPLAQQVDPKQVVTTVAMWMKLFSVEVPLKPQEGRSYFVFEQRRKKNCLVFGPNFPSVQWEEGPGKVLVHFPLKICFKKMTTKRN